MSLLLLSSVEVVISLSFEYVNSTIFFTILVEPLCFDKKLMGILFRFLLKNDPHCMLLSIQRALINKQLHLHAYNYYRLLFIVHLCKAFVILNSTHRLRQTCMLALLLLLLIMMDFQWIPIQYTRVH